MDPMGRPTKYPRELRERAVRVVGSGWSRRSTLEKPETEDQTEGAPICRWRHGQLFIDVMPTSADILGFSNRWYAPAIAAAHHVLIADLRLRVITPVYFVATKLDAFRSRCENDFGGSHDLEDVIAPIDVRVFDKAGRPVDGLQQADFQIFEVGFTGPVSGGSTNS